MRPFAAKVLDHAHRRAAPVLRGRLAAGAPGNVVRSIVESAYRAEVNRHVTCVHEERPARIVEYPLDPRLPMWFRREKALDPVYTYELEDVVASPLSGWVWLEKEGLVFQESVGSLRRFMAHGSRVWETRLPTTAGPDKAVMLPWTGYFHWLLESVPAFLRALRRTPDDTVHVLVPEHGAPKIIGELLSAAGVPHERIVLAARPTRIRSLTLGGLTAYSGFFDEADIALVQSIYAPSNIKERKLYISRRQALKRPMSGEEDLEQHLIERGFEIVFAEELTLEEQSRLFGSARVVVAPHGAGLANLIWRRGPCDVIEIFPSGLHNDCYARLAALLGFTYVPVNASPDPQSAGHIDAASVASNL